jgi:hypothetical protein
MPYYKDLNLLFIHIPKTGGTSLEQYLKKKNTQTLYSTGLYNHILYEKFKLISSLQHLTYKKICKYKNTLEVDFNEDLKIITIVRNPYDRIISDLFYFDLIKENTTSDEVYEVLKKYIYEDCHDNHNIPQYEFLINKKNEIIPNVTIFKTETLTEDLKKYGFTDFNLIFHKNKQNIKKENYNTYLNNDSINLINEFYKKDFDFFNYEIKKIL